MNFVPSQIVEDPTQKGRILVRGKYGDAPLSFELSLDDAYELMSGIENVVHGMRDRYGSGESTAMRVTPDKNQNP